MMLGVDPLLTKFGARLVLQIHDELVFEVPRDHVVAFIREAMSALSSPPCPGFAVPIVLEPKHGTRFGALAWRDAKAIASLRPPRSAVFGLVVPVSSPGGLRGALCKTCACPRAWHEASGALRAPVHWNPVEGSYQCVESNFSFAAQRCGHIPVRTSTLLRKRNLE